MTVTSGPNCTNHDWKLSPNVQLKIVLEKLQIQNEFQDQNVPVPENSKTGPSASIPARAPGGVKRKKMSRSTLPTCTQNETSDPHFNSGEIMQELQKVILEFEPECSVCCKFVFQLSEHIRNLHSTPSSWTPNDESLVTGHRRTSPRNTNNYDELVDGLREPATPTLTQLTDPSNIPNKPSHLIHLGTLTAMDYVKCEADEIDIEVFENEDPLYNSDSHCKNNNEDDSDNDDKVDNCAGVEKEKPKSVVSIGLHKPNKCDKCSTLIVEELTQSNIDLQNHLESHSHSTPLSTKLKLSKGPLPPSLGVSEKNSPVHRRNLRTRKSINYAEHGNQILLSLTAEHVTCQTDTLALDDDVGDSDNTIMRSSYDEEDHNSDSDFEKPGKYTGGIAKSTGKAQKRKQDKCDKYDSGFTTLNSKRKHKEHPREGGQAEFASFKPLSQHRKTYTVGKRKNSKIYKCKTCRICCGSLSDLVEHSKVHTRKRTHKCHTCGTIYMSASRLIQHSKYHTGLNVNKIYKCETCEKHFSKKCVLIMHKRLHSRKRPYKCEQCDKYFLSNATRIKHERSHNSEKCEDCKFCGQQFADRSVLTVHMATHTEDEFIRKNPTVFIANTCDKCNISFYTLMSLNRHNYQVHNIENPDTRQRQRNRRKRVELRRRLLNQNRRVQTDDSEKELHKCKTCGKCFTRNDWSIRHERLHLRTYYNSLIFGLTRFTNKPGQDRLKTQCNICRVKFPSVKDLNAHVILTHKKNLTSPYKCNICEEGFSTSAKIRKHYLDIHARPITHTTSAENGGDGFAYKCDHCDRSFELLQHLDCHMAVHMKEKPHKCETCDMRFYIKDVLISHQSRHAVDKSSNKKYYGCGFCSIKYFSVHDLTVHLKSLHKNMLCNEYVCKICKEDFFSITRLREHMAQVHSGEKPFECEICHMEFATESWLTEHGHKIHKEERTFPCIHKGCEKMFKTKKSLKTHLITHSGIKTHKCDQCEKSYSTSTNLNIHMRTHTGEKPFMCDICSKCFSYREALYLHMLSHKEVDGVKFKPHVCKDCGRGFTLKGQLTTHAKIHTGEKSHMCEECGVCFRLPHQLRAHLKTLAHAK